MALQIHRSPKLSARARLQLDRLDTLRGQLGTETRGPARWLGGIHRLAQVRAAESSIGIEGFGPASGFAASHAADTGSEWSRESEQALECYRRAMDHVGAMATGSGFVWSERVILDLHFDACHFQPESWPGRWRQGPVSVTGTGGGIVYRAPEAADVPGLIDLMLTDLRRPAGVEHPVVRAAMAHLHLVSIHPFRDGNGRAARIVQSLALSLEGLLAPEFASIEEYLGQHTLAYYDALQKAYGPTYDPSIEASKWVEFCIEAHLSQAQRQLDLVKDAATRWAACEKLVADRGWPERFVIALERALTGGLDRAAYAAEAEVKPITASLDFRRLVDAGLIIREGSGPRTRYRASQELLRYEV